MQIYVELIPGKIRSVMFVMFGNKNIGGKIHASE